MSKAIQLIVGLGNPGEQYSKTRHNAGFWLLDQLASNAGVSFKSETKFSGEVAKLILPLGNVWLLKPTTFMNKSGLSVKQLSQFYKIPVESILVVHDELDIPAGNVLLKRAGGHGGHNGLRDIHAHVGKTYWRLRLGISHPGNSKQVADYVLKKPNVNDEIGINLAIDRSLKELDNIINGDFEKAMNVIHTDNQSTKKPSSPDNS